MPTTHLVWELTKTDFKLRYSSSFIGYLWALLKPLLTFLILNFVFSHVFGEQLPFYSLNLLVGIVLWAYFTEGTIGGMSSLLNKAPLISKVAISKIPIVIAATLQTTISFFINAGIVAIFFWYYGVTPGAGSLLLMALFMVLAYGLILGISLALAPLLVRYRDVNQIWEVLLVIGFYGSPIIYPLAVIPAHLQKYLWLNPMSYLINYAKLALINNQHIPWPQLLILICATIAVLLGGGLVFRAYRHRLAEYV